MNKNLVAAEPSAPISLKFPLGVNNRDREYALPEGSLREAINLDVTRDGGLRSRSGIRRIVAGDCHSLYTPMHGRFLLGVVDHVLTRWDAEETAVPLTSVNAPVVYTTLNEQTYWTDGTQVGRVTELGDLGHWGLPTPPEPQVSLAATGGLWAGTYQVAMTARHPSGLESAAARTVSITVPAGGGIQVSTPAALGVSFELYRTGPEGGQEALRSAQRVAPGTTVILGASTLGKSLESLHADAPIPGQALATHKGRIWCASGSSVWITSAKSPHWVFPQYGYYSFESRVSMLAATEDGVFVGTAHRTYYLQGDDPFKMTQRPVSTFGAAAGSAFEIPYDLFLGEGSFPSKQAAWWDTEGSLCIGKPGGIIVRPTHRAYSAGQTFQGVLTYREHDGLRQMISALRAEPGPLASRDVVISERWPHGVVLGD